MGESGGDPEVRAVSRGRVLRDDVLLQGFGIRIRTRRADEGRDGAPSHLVFRWACVAGLVEADIARAGDLKGSKDAPAAVGDGCGELNTLLFELGHGLLNVIAHQEELVGAGGLLIV